MVVERVEGAAAEVSWAGRRWRLGLGPGQAGHASLLGLRGARLRLDGLERAAVEELLGGAEKRSGELRQSTATLADRLAAARRLGFSAAASEAQRELLRRISSGPAGVGPEEGQLLLHCGLDLLEEARLDLPSRSTLAEALCRSWSEQLREVWTGLGLRSALTLLGQPPLGTAMERLGLAVGWLGSAERPEALTQEALLDAVSWHQLSAEDKERAAEALSQPPAERLVPVGLRRAVFQRLWASCPFEGICTLPSLRPVPCSSTAVSAATATPSASTADLSRSLPSFTTSLTHHLGRK